MLRRLALAAVVSCAAFPALQAQLVIDLNQPLHQGQPFIDSQVSGPFGGVGPLNQQSFKPLASNIAGGGFFWHSGGYLEGISPLQSELEITLSTSLSGGLLAQTRVFFTEGALFSGQWVDAFWAPITVTPGATYFLGVRAIQARAIGGPGFTTVPYADGSAFTSGILMDQTGTVPPGGYYDFTFRTWTTAPEPSTWALMAAGLLALGVAARRRRTNA